MLATELPNPPAFDRWVLEQPIPLAAACVVLGLAIFLSLQRRGQSRRGAMGGAMLGMFGVAVLVVGWMVETPRETLRRLTSEFVTRVFAADGEWASEHLSDSLVMASAGTAYLSLGKPELVATIGNFEMFRTTQWSEKSRGGVIDTEQQGRTQTTIKVTAGYLGNQTLPSTWEFTWRRGGDGAWRIARIECVSMWGKPPPFNWERDAIGIARLKPGSGGAGSLKPDGF